MIQVNYQLNQTTLSKKILKYQGILSPALAALLLFSIISRHTGVSSTISLSSISLIYFLLLSVFLLKKDPVFKIERIYIILYSVLSIFVITSMIYNLTQNSIIRFAAFGVFTSMNLFVVPKTIDFKKIVKVLGRITALLVLIGFFPYFGFPTNVGPIDLSLWGARLYLYPAFSPITSIFVAVNWLGFLTLSGSISALGEWWLFKSTVSKLILGINIVGLLFTNYRTGWLAFLAAVGILVIYILMNRKAIKLITFGGIIATIVALAMMFKIIPGPTVFTELSLNNRRGSWIGGVQGLRNQPFWGYGFGNTATALEQYIPPGSPANVHNSFLRAFVALGIGGGIAYSGLFLITMIKSTSQAVSKTGVILTMFLVSYFIVQLFNSLSFIGLSLHSVVIAITMGYQINKSALHVTPTVE